MRFRFLILRQLAQINNRKKKRNIQFQSFSSPMFNQSHRFLAITMRIEMNNDKKKKNLRKNQLSIFLLASTFTTSHTMSNQSHYLLAVLYPIHIDACATYAEGIGTRGVQTAERG